MIDFTKIQSRFQAGETDQQILDALHAESNEVVLHNPRVLSDVRELLPADEWAAFRLALDAATDPANIPDDVSADPQGKAAVAKDIEDAIAAMRGPGISLGYEDRQALIDMLGGMAGLPAESIGKIKRLGRYTEYPYTDITLADVAQARLDWFAAGLVQRVSAAINLAAVAEGATEQSIRDAAIAEAE